MKKSRRLFLRNSLGAAIALPFLPSLMGRARAAAGHKRLVVFHMPHNETDQFLPGITSGPLDLSNSDERTGTYMNPLSEFSDRALLFSGLVGASGHHQATSEFLSGRPRSDGAAYSPTQGPTLDQYIAGRLGDATRLPSLQLAISNERRIAEDYVVLSYSESNRPVPGYWRTSDAFRAVYSGATPTMSDGSAEREAAFQTSLLNGVMGQYHDLQRRISAEDRQLMDQHLDYLSTLEGSVGSTPTVTCEVPSEVPEDWPTWTSDPEDKQRQIREHLEIAAGALRCDATRVITINIGGGGVSGTYTWAGVTDAHHQIAHQAVENHRPQHFRWRQYIAEQMANFCRMLDEVPDGDGTLLDSTAVVWLPELGLWGTEGGNSHRRTNVPGCIIGGCGGFFRGGEVVDLAGMSYHNLLLTLGHAMGYEDLLSFGDHGTEVLNALKV